MRDYVLIEKQYAHCSNANQNSIVRTEGKIIDPWNSSFPQNPNAFIFHLSIWAAMLISEQRKLCGCACVTRSKVIEFTLLMKSNYDHQCICLLLRFFAEIRDGQGYLTSAISIVEIISVDHVGLEVLAEKLQFHHHDNSRSVSIYVFQGISLHESCSFWLTLHLHSSTNWLISWLDGKIAPSLLINWANPFTWPGYSHCYNIVIFLLCKQCTVRNSLDTNGLGKCT